MMRPAYGLRLGTGLYFLVICVCLIYARDGAMRQGYQLGRQTGPACIYADNLWGW